MTIRDQVLEFHKALGVRVRDVPTVPTEDEICLRLKLIAEEFSELLEALHGEASTRVAMEGVWWLIGWSSHKPAIDVVEVADALADLAYVVEGTNQVFGIDSGPVAAEVHRSNMSKLGGAIRADGKIQKGPKYSPPDLARVLREQGWSG